MPQSPVFQRGKRHDRQDGVAIDDAPVHQPDDAVSVAIVGNANGGRCWRTAFAIIGKCCHNPD